mgnify:CR=1 FL=1
MVLNWSYFLILQTVVLATFYFLRNIKENNVLNKLFQTKTHFIIANTCIFLSCYFYNTQRQLFCRPVPWAATVIVLFCISFLVLPLINKQSKFLNLVAAVCGLGFFIAVYIIFFARYEYLIFVAFNVPFILILHFILRFVKRKFKTNVFDALYFYPAIVLTPFLLLFQLWVFLKSLQTKTQKRLFVATPVLTLIVCLILAVQINNIINRISVAKDKEKELKEIVSNPINYYLTELILGAHWKYHTELCLYDGWRPPFHDPVLVAANKVLFPFAHFYQGTDLQNANKLYKVIYPNKPTSFDCKCASKERLFE